MSRASEARVRIEALTEKVDPVKEKEIRAAITAYSKELHAWFRKESGLKVKKRSIKASGTAVVNPYIEMNGYGLGKFIPNELRLMVAKKMGFNVSNTDDVVYGNIDQSHITLTYREWIKVFPDKNAPEGGYTIQHQ